MKLIFMTIAVVSLATGAVAQCPAKAPISIKTAADEQRVNAEWLQKTLVGRKLSYSIGSEHFGADGSYKWVSGSQEFAAGSYKFYADGTRCIGYGNPRFDRYVVKDGKIFLINAGGERHQAKLTN